MIHAWAQGAGHYATPLFTLPFSRHHAQQEPSSSGGRKKSNCAKSSKESFDLDRQLVQVQSICTTTLSLTRLYDFCPATSFDTRRRRKNGGLHLLALQSKVTTKLASSSSHAGGPQLQAYRARVTIKQKRLRGNNNKKGHDTSPLAPFPIFTRSWLITAYALARGAP